MRKSALFVLALCVATATSSPAVFGQTNAAPYRDGRSICVPYNPATLTVNDIGGAWDLRRSDGAIFKVFVSLEDASAGLAVAKQNNELCYIGKDNTRPDRIQYIMEYWQKK